MMMCGSEKLSNRDKRMGRENVVSSEVDVSREEMPVVIDSDAKDDEVDSDEDMNPEGEEEVQCVPHLSIETRVRDRSDEDDGEGSPRKKLS